MNGCLRWFCMMVGAAMVLASAQVVLAHPHPSHLADGWGHAWSAGLLHPLLGLDHLLAMWCSGLLAVRMMHRQALWLVPASFAGLMLCGGFAALLSGALALAEWGIGLSVIVLGLAVALLPRVPLAAGVAVVGLFAVCHGHAHVAEFSGQSLWPYLAGLTVATLAMHAVAIGCGLLIMRSPQPRAVQVAGGAAVILFLLAIA